MNPIFNKGSCTTDSPSTNLTINIPEPIDPSSSSGPYKMHALPPDSTSSSEPEDCIPRPEDSIPRLPSDSNNEVPTRYNSLDFKRSQLDADKIINNDDSDIIINKNIPKKVEDKDVGNKLDGKSITKQQADHDRLDEFDDIISNIDSEISTLKHGLDIENKAPDKGDSKLGTGSTLSCNFYNDVIANPSVTIATDM